MKCKHSAQHPAPWRAGNTDHFSYMSLLDRYLASRRLILLNRDNGRFTIPQISAKICFILGVFQAPGKKWQMRGRKITKKIEKDNLKEQFGTLSENSCLEVCTYKIWSSSLSVKSKYNMWSGKVLLKYVFISSNFRNMLILF